MGYLVGSFNNVTCALSSLLPRAMNVSSECLQGIQRSGSEMMVDTAARAALLGAGIAHAAMGVRDLVNIRQIKNVQDRVFQVVKASIFIGVAAVETAISIYLPPVTLGGPLWVGLQGVYP